MGYLKMRFFLLCTLITAGFVSEVLGYGCNWGTRSTHLLQPNIVVKLLEDNGFKSVKLFEADAEVMQALGNSGLQVMIGIQNDMLAELASTVEAAENFVSQNVSSYISKYGVDIRYIAVGNEPFLKTYNGSFLQTTYPAMQNIQAALIKAGLGRQVKVTIPLNADVYQTDNGLPSGGNFRPEISSLMTTIVKFISDNAGVLTINIYPFLSLNADPNFPIDYAFFSGGTTIVDGSITYTNVLDANYDTFVWALEKIGYPSVPIIIGEVGWPTDGDPNANVEYARKFNQGLFNRIVRGLGTPKRPTPPVDIYLFSLIDEDAKSIDPGKFERHWGMFNYDGTMKYSLNIGNSRSLVPAKGVRYLAKQWCIMMPQANLGDPNLAGSIDYACTFADCTSLGYGSSCGQLDARANASYAFNMYYQTMNQQKGACQFSNLSIISTTDPSQGTCRFEIMIDTKKRYKNTTPAATSSSAKQCTMIDFVLLLLIVFRNVILGCII